MIYLIILIIWLVVGFIRYKKVVNIFSNGFNKFDVVLVFPFLILLQIYEWIKR